MSLLCTFSLGPKVRMRTSTYVAKFLGRYAAYAAKTYVVTHVVCDWFWIWGQIIS